MRVATVESDLTCEYEPPRVSVRETVRGSMPECALRKNEERLRSSQTFYASSSTRLSRAQVVISKGNGHERVERWQSWTAPSPQWPFTINACSPLTIAKTFRCPRCNCILYHRDWGEPRD